ncbi:NNMT/PNMT/TEMT family protein [Brugia malayi]|uniref:NNMT/PNMT/TEMT family protein n=1 Tax=Brugia malayi TaxID=6279 RepID=A0A4E9F520_BRUMA|nr:NNMT/PNMT/TEMT family protein [Brugia malayi]VIO91072.1 NNMT/PNMT/TEMT family protein [Brugia malayi]
MSEITSSKVTSSSTIDSVSRKWKEKPDISTKISHDDAMTDDIVPELCSAAEQAINFNPDEYLQAFYSMPTKDVAMHTILFFLPGILYWIPEEIRTLLDLGADCAENSCNMLKNWAKNKSSFEWTEVCKWIASIEGSNELPVVMEQSARSRFKAVLRADLHAEPTIKCVHYKCSDSDDIPQQFHVVVSIFCLEYSSENLEGYRHAVRSAVNLIEPNGFLIQGGVLQANDYYFGNKRYRCHHLTKEQVIESLKENNMAVEKEMTLLK